MDNHWHENNNVSKSMFYLRNELYPHCTWVRLKVFIQMITLDWTQS